MKRAPLLIGLAAAGGAAAFLSSRRRRDAAKGAIAETAAPAPQATRDYDDITLARTAETDTQPAEPAPASRPEAVRERAEDDG